MTVRCGNCNSKELKVFETSGSFGRVALVVCTKGCGWGEVVNEKKLRRRTK